MMYSDDFPSCDLFPQTGLIDAASGAACALRIAEQRRPSGGRRHVSLRKKYFPASRLVAPAARYGSESVAADITLL